MRILALVAILGLVACEPASVAEAEARRDVSWLEKHESRASFEALGRLADHDAHAAARLESKIGNTDVDHAAWQAHTRGAAWGARVLRARLSAPAEVPLVIAELPMRDPRVAPFIPELEKAVGATTGATSIAVAALIASIGPPAQPALSRLLDAPSTRDAVCTGLGGPDTSHESHYALVKAKPETRATPACRQTLLKHALMEVSLLEWLGDAGEAPLVEAAAEMFECPKVDDLWERIFASPREGIVELEPALAKSAARCELSLDPVLSRALLATPRVRASVLRALDTDAIRPEELVATCKQLPRLAHSRSIPDDVRALATALLAKRCSKV